MATRCLQQVHQQLTLRLGYSKREHAWHAKSHKCQTKVSPALLYLIRMTITNSFAQLWRRTLLPTCNAIHAGVRKPWKYHGPNKPLASLDGPTRYGERTINANTRSTLRHAERGQKFPQL